MSRQVPEEKLKQIFVIRTMEPDRQNKNSKRQVKREFLQMSETEYFAPENLDVARELHRKY